MTFGGQGGRGETRRFEGLVGSAVEVRVDESEREDGSRSYLLRTTATLRDSRPTTREVCEQPGFRVKSASALFDALVALARAEVELLSVDRIANDAFRHGDALRCPPGGCFETGRLWNYVWTRDTAYAVDLALAWIDPVRARNSLAFKLSETRAGGSPEVVQDTGSGGSYPVSTDRVVWALGAEALLAVLDGEDRAAFAELALEALRNTIERDRVVVFDARDGLYRGEQSFLDWREQSYPAWTADDTVHIGMSKSLSTNVAHLRAIELVARLSREAGDITAQRRYEQWADALRPAIHEHFYLGREHGHAAFLTTACDRAPARQHDLLGTCLAVLAGVTPSNEAAGVIADWPTTIAGPPVIWPQQKHAPIYHNRSVWPFVTAYWARAGARVGHGGVVFEALRSLVRGASVHLSNMENLEMTTGADYLQDGELSGPVVNSERQLWSVAGYLSAVVGVVFGLEPLELGLRLAPMVTRRMQSELLGGGEVLELENWSVRGRSLSLRLKLPKEAVGIGGIDDPFVVERIAVDGREVPAQHPLPWSRFAPSSQLDVTLGVARGARARSASPVRRVFLLETEVLYGPSAPVIRTIRRGEGGVRLAFSGGSESPGAIRFEVLRDGEVIASNLPGTSNDYLDDSPGAREGAPWYSVRSYYASSGNRSQHARPRSAAEFDEDAVFDLLPEAFELRGGALRHDQGRAHVAFWGAKEDEIRVKFTARRTGLLVIRVQYANGGPISTGVTCAIKRLEVHDRASGRIAGAGYVVMPHTGAWDAYRDSNPLAVTVEAGVAYEIRLLEDDSTINMSEFAHFADYTAGLGGEQGRFNGADVAAFRCLEVGWPGAKPRAIG